MKGKKGDGKVFRVMVYLILFLMLLVIIILINNQIFGTVSKNMKNVDCTSSVAFATALSNLNLKNMPLKCRTGDLYIDEDLSSERGQNSAKFRIAEEMVSCWTKFGRGRIKLFEEEKIYCNICSVVQFSDQNRDKGRAMEGFSNYLNTKEMPYSKITYQDYLLTYETPKIRKVIDNPAIFDKAADQFEDKIASDNDYAVIFTYAVGEKSVTQIKKYFSLGSGHTFVGSAVIGAGGAVAAVVLLSNPIGWKVGAVIFVGTLIHEYFSDHPKDWFTGTFFVDYNKEELRELRCGELR